MKAVKFSVAAAAVLALSTAAMAEAPTIYGQLHGEFGSFYDKTSEAGVLGTQAKGTRVGFKGTKDFGGGLVGLYQVESGFDKGYLGSENQSGSGDWASRNTFAGLKGDFGTVLIGRHDTPYKMAARGAGTVTHSDATDTLSLNENRLAGAVAYVAPMSDMTVAAAIVPVKDDNRTQENDGMHMSLGFVMPVGEALKIGAGYESAYQVDADATQDNMFVAANYAMGAMTIGAAFETQSDDGDAVYTRMLVPFTMKMDGGLFVNAALRNTDYDASDDAEMAVSASVGKKFGSSEAYVALKSVTADSGVDGVDTSDVALGLRVKF